MSTTKEISDHAFERHGSAVACKLLPGKGRILLSGRNFTAGEVIFSEEYLHAVEVSESNKLYRRLVEICEEKELGLEPIWFWCALNSLLLPTSAFTAVSSCLKTVPYPIQEKLLTLYAPQSDDLTAEGKKVLRELRLSGVLDAERFDHLLRVWVFSCYEHSLEPQGFAIFYLASFISHSCTPNAVWFVEPHQKHLVLRARTNICEGTEINISYLAEDDLLLPAPQRNKVLSNTKRFVCNCDRCTLDLCRGVRCPECRASCIYLSKRGSVCTKGCGHRLTVLERRKFEQAEKQVSKWVKLCGEPLPERIVSLRKSSRRAEKWKATGLEGSVELIEEACKRPIERTLEGKRLTEVFHALRSLFYVHWILYRFAKLVADSMEDSEVSIPVFPRGLFSAAPEAGSVQENGPLTDTMEVNLNSKESCLLFCLRQISEMYPDGPCGNYAWTLEQLGDEYKVQGRLDKAAEHYQKAVKTLECLFGTDSSYCDSVRRKMRK